MLPQLVFSERYETSSCSELSIIVEKLQDHSLLILREAGI